MSLMDYWALKRVVQRKITDYWPVKVPQRKPLTQLKITYYWAVKKGPIPIKRKMQRRIVEVHAPQRIHGDTPRMVMASGWDSLRSHGHRRSTRSSTAASRRSRRRPSGSAGRSAPSRRRPGAATQACASPLRTCPISQRAQVCSQRTGTATSPRSMGTSAACATRSAGPQASPRRTTT